MKKILSILILPLLFTVVSCSDSDNDDNIPQLKVTGADVVFEAAGGTGAIEFEADMAVTAIPGQQWIKIDNTAAGRITFTVDPMDDLLGRATAITLKSGSIVQTVAIRQLGLYFDVSGTVELQARGGRQLLDLNTNAAATFDSDQDWCDVETVGGDFYLVYEGNKTAAARSATITVEAAGRQGTITVNQKGLAFEPSATSLNIPAAGGSASLEVSPNIGDIFSVVPQDTWYVVSVNGDVITVTAEANTGARRTSTITVKYQSLSATVNVIQPAQ